jgi:hypothetical protein
MLLDLPPEPINLIVGHIAPPPELPSMQEIETCPCVPREDRNLQLVLSDTEYDQLRTAYETDVLRFGVAYPYIAGSISNGGWQGVVDSMWMLENRGYGIIPCVPEELRSIVRYVPLLFVESGIFNGCTVDGSHSQSPSTSITNRRQTTLFGRHQQQRFQRCKPFSASFRPLPDSTLLST